MGLKMRKYGCASHPLELEAAGLVLGRDYPHPIVDHAEARARTLERYAVVKKVK